MDFTMPYEQAIRWIVFVGIFCGLAALEVYSPRRKLDTAKPIRWASNGLMLVADMLFLRVLLSTSAVYLAYLGQQQGWGLLNHFGIGGFGGSWPAGSCSTWGYTCNTC